MALDVLLFIANLSQEYLSKPLKQNQLIQTILKCATMGGAMLEHKNNARRSLMFDNSASELSRPGTPTTPKAGKRPGLESRAFTEAPFGRASPAIVTADVQNPMERVSTLSWFWNPAAV